MEDKYYWDSFDCEIQCEEYWNEYIYSPEEIIEGIEY